MGLPDPDGQRTAILKKMRATKTDDALSSLSPREREILRLIADGTSIRDIAARLCISPKTVESHKYNILTKLRVCYGSREGGPEKRPDPCLIGLFRQEL